MFISIVHHELSNVYINCSSLIVPRVLLLRENLSTDREAQEDGILKIYEEHEDSVYQIAWSCTDPWIFASLSYDGRIVINRVPRLSKYSILL